jgi:hypothetical protein
MLPAIAEARVGLINMVTILGRPVSIKGFTGKFLSTAYQSGSGIKFNGDVVNRKEHWLIFPIDDGQVIVRHLKTNRNL